MPLDELMTLPPQAAAAAGTTAPSTTSPTDAALIRDCLAGNTAAFDEIVRQHGSRVLNYVLNMTRHRQDAEDITQQTFIKAYTHLARFDPGHSFIGWLLTIARRTALNHFRSARQFEPMADSLAETTPSPARQAERADLLNTIWNEARRVLPPREFEVMWLRYAEDLPIEETARIVGLTQTHTKIIAFRARQRLLKLQSKS